MSNEWNWHVNSLQTRLNDLQSTIDSIKSCVEKRPGLDAATKAIGALIESSTQGEYALQEFPIALSQILVDPAIGALMFGPQGEIVLYNAAAEQLLGRDYMLDKSVTSVQFSSEDRSKRLIADELPWSRALKGEALPDVRLHLSRPSNNDTWLNVSATPFRSPQGTVNGVVVFLIDTTEEVQLESSISNLCNTIHDQIAQVGTTHTQLRDLADRLSKTGIQRILSDADSGSPSSKPSEDPGRKKSHPRRDEGESPSAARQESLPEAEEAAQEDEFARISTPAEAVEPEQAGSVESVDVEVEAEIEEEEPEKQPIITPPPRAEKAPPNFVPPLPEPTSERLNQKALGENQNETISPIYSSNAYDDEDEERNQDESGSWATVNTAPETTLEAGPVDFVEGRKTLEIEAVDALADPTTAQTIPDSDEEIPAEFPTESIVEKLPEIPLASAEPAVAEEEEEQNNANEEPNRWSAQYAQKYEGSEAAEEAEAPKQDFWVSGYQPAEESGTDGDTTKATSEGDEVVDSAKSLFGKFANLTKDSYSESKSDDKEPDPALPWPELVDGDNYGEPLWDEYTQSEEETTPWQQDKVDEIGEEQSPVARPALSATPAPPPVAPDNRLPTESGDVDFAAMDEMPTYTIPQAHAESGPSVDHDEVVNEEPEVVVAAEPETEASPYAPPAAEAVEVEHEEAPAAYSQEGGESITDSTGYTAPGIAKPSGLKGDSKKPRPSASYNRLKPLSAAAELNDIDPEYEEGLTEQVVRFSSDESLAEDEGPRRVLVVDDIPVNQKLLLLHLKRLGYEADVASNGQEALDMIAEKKYELILMDCDMPVMSGFEAASRIRSNEAFSHHRIPIIALTSYDREGDKEKCIAAGMDDYITKGASQKELKDTIERSIVSARMKDDSEGYEDAESEAPPDIGAMLKMYGKEEVEEISRLFLSNMGTYIECMQLAIDNKDGESVTHYANAVKGPCAALGMRLMTRLTSDIMAYAESADWTQVRVKYMRLKAVFVQTREELKKVCPDDSLLAT